MVYFKKSEEIKRAKSEINEKIQRVDKINERLKKAYLYSIALEYKLKYGGYEINEIE